MSALARNDKAMKNSPGVSNRSPDARKNSAPIFAAALACVAVFLGGGTQAWSQAVVFLGLGILCFFKTGRGRPGGALIFTGVALLALGACAFLPSQIFSAQPWLTAAAWLSMFAGVLWVWMLAAQNWTREERLAGARAFALGAGAIACAAVFEKHTHIKIPFWHSEFGFGPFPNRNQTGDFFALGALIASACAREDFAAKKPRAFFWLPLLAALVAATAMSFSRGAMLVLCGGLGAWLLVCAVFSRSPKGAAVALSVIFVLLTLVLLAGHETARRFFAPRGDGGLLGFRSRIYADALAMIRAAPWCGFGLGNFDALFPLFRSASSTPQRVIHPESDWLWLAAETGWLGVAIVAGAFGLLASRTIPFEKGTSRHLRAAAAVAALGFVAHGFIDVAGHRLGSAFAGIFVFSLAWNPAAKSKSSSRWLRATALALAVCALAIFASLAGFFPSPFLLADLKARAGVLAFSRDAVSAKKIAGAALQFAPLDWELHFYRGAAEARAGEWIAASRDFDQANFLERTSPDLPFEEGRVWLGINPALTLPRWREALRRSPRGDAGLYARMLGEVGDAPGLRWPLGEMAFEDPARVVVFFSRASAEEFDFFAGQLLRRRALLVSLDEKQRAALLKICAGKNRAEELARALTDWSPASKK